MVHDDVEREARLALFAWYLSADYILRDLDGCQVVADAMLCGSATPNLLAATALDTLTVQAELWLAAHPCTEQWNGEHMAALVHAYMDVGALVVEAGGDLACIDIADKVTDARLMLGEVRDIISQLAIADEK